MKYISKGNSPSEFEKWKDGQGDLAGLDWDELKNPIKGKLRGKLLEDQGYICCYCEQGIGLKNISDCHIEHLKPKSKHPNLKFDFKNLLVSCNGVEKAFESDQTYLQDIHQHKCGHFKGEDDELLLSPMNEECESYFIYKGNGKISPVDDLKKHDIAKRAIKQLHLDAADLDNSRYKAISHSLTTITPGDKEELRNQIEKYKNRKNGKFEPFCTACIYMLRKKLRKLTSN